MARGKHASSAEARRVREAAESEVVRLGRENGKLRAELAELQQSLNDTLDTMNAETKRLRILVAAGTSEVVQQRDERISELIKERNEARDETKKLRELWNKAYGSLMDHFKDEHGMTGADAVQEATHAVGFAGYITDGPWAAKFVKGQVSVEDVERLELARGIRSKASLERNRERDAEPITVERPW